MQDPLTDSPLTDLNLDQKNLDPNEPITITFTRAEWDIVTFLIGRGAADVLDNFLRGRSHTLHCIDETVRVAKSLNEQVRPSTTPPSQPQ